MLRKELSNKLCPYVSQSPCHPVSISLTEPASFAWGEKALVTTECESNLCLSRKICTFKEIAGK